MEKTKKTILVTGSGGLLGKALVKHLRPRYKLIPLGHKSCDIQDTTKLKACLRQFSPWMVIHCAALTDVDKCELSPKMAKDVNVKGAYNIARAARAQGAILIFISTDYVFSGKKRRPYREDDLPRPLSVYAQTKLRGEQITRRLVKKHIIIRTSWLFGKGKTNFIDTVLKRSQGTRPLKIVADKYACPTDVCDLARAIEKMIDLIRDSKWQDKFYGTYHITNSGFCSWYSWARYILKKVKVKIKVKPIMMTEMNFRARRPPFSVLDNSKYIKTFGFRLRPWQEAVREYLRNKGLGRG